MVDYDKPILNSVKEPLTIGMMSSHNCIRVTKRTRALQKLGYIIHGLAHRTTYGTDEFETLSVWENEKQFKNSVKSLVDLGVDILDYSNEPDYPVTWAKEVVDSMGANVPIVADLHDLDSVRRKENIIPKVERRMFNDADGLIYVSKSIQDITNKLHAVTKPNICLYSYCNKGLVELDDNIERTNALVYEGGVNPLDDAKMNEMFPYRNLFPIFKQLVTQGNEVHAILGNASAFASGQHTGVTCWQPQLYDTMMQMLIKYKWGILVFNNEHDTEPQVKYTLTNKMHEYLQAGLPSITMWCEETENYVKKHDIGLVFDDITKIGDCTHLQDDYNRIIENVKVKRNQLVMENFIWKLENLYADLLGVDGKNIPDSIIDLNTLEYE